MIASRKGPHWRLNEDEKFVLSKGTVGVVRHIPLVPKKEIGILADLSAFAVGARDIVGKRLQIDAQIAQGKHVGYRQAPEGPWQETPVQETGRQPFPTGAPVDPYIVDSQGNVIVPQNMEKLSPEARGEVQLADGMTDDRALLEKMGVSAHVADALVNEAQGGQPAVTVLSGHAADVVMARAMGLPEPPFEPDMSAAPTVANTDPQIIERIAAQGRDNSLEDIVRAYGAGEGRPLLDILAPLPTAEFHPNGG